MELRRYPVLVTGANGFVGSSLTDELIRRGCTVRALMRQNCDQSLLEGMSCERLAVDYCDRPALEHACSGVGVVFHLAARASDWGKHQWFREANLEVTKAIAQAAIAAQVRRIVFVSSAVVYGCGAVCEARESEVVSRFHFDYPRTKRQAEEYLLGLKDIEVVIVRPGDVIGPRDKVVSAPLLRAVRRGILGYVGSGDTVCCYTYIGNLVRALLLAAERGRTGEVYNVSDGVRITWRQLFTQMAKELGCGPPKLQVPLSVAFPVAAALEWLHTRLQLGRDPYLTRYRVLRAARDCSISIAKARRELGYEPDHDFAAQIKATVDWFRQYECAGHAK